MKYFFDTEFHEYEGKTFFGKPNGKMLLEMISIGIVSEDGREYYAVCREFDISAAWNNIWLRVNVFRHIFNDLVSNYPAGYQDPFGDFNFNLPSMEKLIKRFGKSKKQIAKEIESFVNTCDHFHVEGCNLNCRDNNFYAYYADYDWVLFCQLFGGMMKIPKRFPMYCRDLKQEFDRIQNSKPNVQRVSWKAIEQQNLQVKDAFRLENDPKYPKQDKEHHALEDARWNKRLYSFLESRY